MPRNSRFFKGREPFKDRVDLEPVDIHGTFSFLNPTHAQYQFDPTTTQQKPTVSLANTKRDHLVGDQDSDKSVKAPTSSSGVHFLWRSRDNRKGRHTLVVPKDNGEPQQQNTLPKPTSSFRYVARTTLTMLTSFRPWDISWLVAYLFTLGSVVWVLNGFFSFLPYIRPSSTFSGEVAYAGGITAFIGAIVFFETGSILLMLEAVNENHGGCFGWAVEEVLNNKSDDENGSSGLQIHPDRKQCRHHHQNKQNFVGKSTSEAVTNVHNVKPAEEKSDAGGKSWQWFPSIHDLRTHYIHELGFLACSAQFLGATIFGISGFTALPGIENHLSQPVLNGIYWVPQIVGGSGFIVSGLLFMLETQRNWYTPAFGVLGWHIGLWNLIGALGFTLCGALGPAYGDSKAQYQAACSTFWGSFAFLIGSLLQWYESVGKNPVEVAS